MTLGEFLASRALRAAFVHVEQLLSQSLPLLGYAVAAATSRRSRAAWLIAPSALLLGLVALRPDYVRDLLASLVGLTYYFCASVVAYRLQPAAATGKISKDALFCLLFVAFVALPTLLFRAIGIVPLLTIGWLLVFSTYSYCVDAPSGRAAPTFGGFLFFVFLDPSLVYPERARKPSSSVQSTPAAKAPLLRLFTGYCMAVVGGALIDSAPGLVLVTPAGATSGAAHYTNTVINGFGLIFALYWLRSGVVHVRIGLLELLGYRVREAYDHPYRATSPSDFWRRWNLYVGHWARRYVFGPLAIHLTRSFRRRWPQASRQLAQASAVIATFAFIGLLHDALNFAGESRTNFGSLKTFMSAALALLVWEAVSLALARSSDRAAAPMVWRMHAVTGRLYLVHYLVALFVIRGVL